MSAKPTHEQLQEQVRRLEARVRDLESGQAREAGAAPLDPGMPPRNAEQPEKLPVEESLRQSEERYRHLFNNAQVGLVRTRLSDGMVLEINDLGAQIFQYSRDEMIGKENSLDHYADPADRDRMVGLLKAQGYVSNYETRMKRRDGTVFWACFSLRLFPESGCMEGAIQDVSPRKAVEDALQESEERFKSLIQQSPFPYALYAMDGTMVDNNPAHFATWGAPRDEIIGKYNILQDQVVMGDENVRNNILRAFAGEVVQGHPTHFKPGRRFNIARDLWLKTTLYPIKRKGEVVNVVIVHEDITKRKAAEEELERTHKKLVEAAREAGMAEVATGVLHNTGNVLNSVYVAAGALRERIRTSKMAGFSRVAALIQEQGDNLGDFIRNDERGKNLPAYLTELSRHLAGEHKALLEDIQSLVNHVDHIVNIVSLQQSFGQAKGLVEPVLIQEILEAALAIHQASVARHGIRVVRDYENLPPVLVDRNKLLAVLVNLVANAKHAITEARPALGVITLSLAKNPQGQVVIVVSDNGAGIPRENLNRVFTHGFTTRKGGHGYGLHSGALAAREMGGSLDAASAGPGKGAVFSLTIPFRTTGG